MPEPVTPNPDPLSEITLEEWIESCQSCCGVEPESCREVRTAPDNSMGDGAGACEKISLPRKSDENSQ
jgi:hypothetical protein